MREVMLGVGIDWAEQSQLVALGSPDDGVSEVVRAERTAPAVNTSIARLGRLKPDPPEVRVVIETSHGMLAEALMDAGYPVLPVNPDPIARRRGPARKNDDTEDVRIACQLALDRFTTLRALIPHGAVAAQLRAIARDDERAARNEHLPLNRLRADLISTFPTALAIAGDDLAVPTVLRLLQRWPTAAALAETSTTSLPRSPAPRATAGPSGSPTGSGPSASLRANHQATAAPRTRPARVSEQAP